MPSFPLFRYVRELIISPSRPGALPLCYSEGKERRRGCHVYIGPVTQLERGPTLVHQLYEDKVESVGRGSPGMECKNCAVLLFLISERVGYGISALPLRFRAVLQRGRDPEW